MSDDFTPTPEQLAIVEAARDTTDNLLVTALAGAAKTSTLVLIANAVQVPTLAISFNTRIAKEMKERLPAWCESRTLNSLGQKVWTDNKGRRPVVDPGKTFRLVKDYIEATQDPEVKGALYENMGDLMRSVGGGKTAGYIPSGLYPEAKPLMRDEEMLDWLDEQPSDEEWDLIRAVSAISLAEGLGKGKAPGQSGQYIIDFDDQLLLPTVFPVSFASPALVLIDEAQDLSALNHAMMKKFCRRRVIAVGDENQSIYGFRGAHEDSMQLMEQSFNMRRLLLTISFRCPISVVEAARFRAPIMQYPAWAKVGKVTHLNHWGEEDLPDDAVILCRNNAPLFNMCIRLIKNDRFPELVGNDIGKTLVKWLKKLGPETLDQESALFALDVWKAEKLLKSKSPQRVEDQAQCLAIFIKEGKTLGDACAFAAHLLERGGPVKLMTIHKAKGLEWHNVFILDEDLIGAEDQEKNLRYVAITRAKSTLTYIKSEDFRGKDDE